MPDPVKLHKDEPVNKVIATGLTITVGLTNDRQMTFQSGFEGDEADASINARLDRIMRFADRQKAIYEIPEIEDELFKHRETLANFIEDRDRVEANHVTAQAGRKVQIEELQRLRGEALIDAETEIDATILRIQETKKAELDAGIDEHRHSGKLGSYRPKGNRARNITLADEALVKAANHKDAALGEVRGEYDRQIDTVFKEIDRAEAEKTQTLSNIGISVERYEEAIAERQAKLAKRKAVAEG